MAQPMGDGDITRLNLAIDRMNLAPLTPRQRRRAATTVCDVMGRSGDEPQTIRVILQMLELSNLAIGDT